MREDVKDLLDEVILDIRRRLPFGNYPADMDLLIRCVSKCEKISYRKLAELNHCEVRDIVRYLKNPDGCTHYRRKTGHYLIAVNEDGRSPVRIRWTTAHEIGHIAAGHFLEIDEDFLPPNRMMEEEANYFAANLLAPFDEIWKSGAAKPADIRDRFGISQDAAEYRWKEYLRSRCTKSLTTLSRAVDIFPDSGEQWAL